MHITISNKLIVLANLLVIALNSFILFAPKRPMHGVSSNAAGGLALIAIGLLLMWLLHLVLTVVGAYFRKAMLLKIMLLIMVPATIMAGYWLLRLIQF